MHDCKHRFGGAFLMPLKQLPPAAPGSVRDRKRELLRKYSGAFSVHDR